MRVLGVDPGETTGYALCDYDSQTQEMTVVEWGEWHGMEELEQKISAGLFTGVQAMAIEMYIVYPNRARTHIGDKLYTAQEIGRLKWIARQLGISRVKEQPASMAKQRWSDTRLRKHGFGAYLSSDLPHRTDALRHALTYIERKKK